MTGSARPEACRRTVRNDCISGRPASSAVAISRMKLVRSVRDIEGRPLRRRFEIEIFVGEASRGDLPCDSDSFSIEVAMIPFRVKMPMASARSSA